MRIVHATLLAVALAALAVACGGKAKNNTMAPAPKATAGDNANGGAAYGGMAAPEGNPCGSAKSDPCGGGE